MVVDTQRNAHKRGFLGFKFTQKAYILAFTKLCLAAHKNLLFKMTCQ